MKCLIKPLPLCYVIYAEEEMKNCKNQDFMEIAFTRHINSDAIYELTETLKASTRSQQTHVRQKPKM